MKEILLTQIHSVLRNNIHHKSSELLNKIISNQETSSLLTTNLKTSKFCIHSRIKTDHSKITFSVRMVKMFLSSIGSSKESFLAELASQRTNLHKIILKKKEASRKRSKRKFPFLEILLDLIKLITLNLFKGILFYNSLIEEVNFNKLCESNLLIRELISKGFTLLNLDPIL